MGDVLASNTTAVGNVAAANITFALLTHASGLWTKAGQHGQLHDCGAHAHAMLIWG